ncbi:MAG: ATP-binding protein [Ginsengibacter sp.]
MLNKKLYFNWSSGKDSALALYQLSKDARFHVDLLVTTINLPQDRISMHGVRRELLIAQFESLKFPYRIIDLPDALTMETYNSIMRRQISTLREEAFSFAGFGDILLEDVKAYREHQLKEFNIEAVFPLWKKNTLDVVHQFIDEGFKAIVVSINSTLLDKSFCGRLLDKSFLEDLPAGVDPCGENGEYHTFCFDGPLFEKPVNFSIGEKVYKEYKAPKDIDEDETNPQEQKIGFWFCDLLPKI